MSKPLIPLFAPDISTLAQHIAKQLNEKDRQPSHLALLNVLARASGFRNFQHLRAAHSAQARLATENLPENVDFRLVERVLNQYDQTGCLMRWPSRRAVQDLCIWSLWADLPPAKSLHERQVNGLLRGVHHFDDPALLRRSLVSLGLVRRNNDGSDYRRVERRPPAEAREVIRLVKARRDATIAP